MKPTKAKMLIDGVFDNPFMNQMARERAAVKIVEELEAKLAESAAMVEAWRIRAEAHRQAKELSDKSCCDAQQSRCGCDDMKRLDWLLSAKRVYLFSPDKKNSGVGRYLCDRDDIDAEMSH